MPSNPTTRRVVNFVLMDPNKRGPVELQLVETARQWTGRGGTFASYFLAPAPDWYAELMSAAGGELGVLDAVTNHRSWDLAVLDAAARDRPDIAHIHFGHHTVAGRLRRAGSIVVRTEHSERSRQRLALARRVVRHWQQRQLTAFVAVSDHLAAQTRRDFLVRAQKVNTIHNGVDLTHFRPRPADRKRLRSELFGICDDGPVITEAAHLIPRKRQAMLIAALPTLLAAEPRTHVVIAGGGPDEAALRSLIAELGVTDSVSLLVEDNDVAAIYAASDIGVLPSSREGLGGSAVEAMACGLPLVATPVGGLREIPEPGVSGVLVHDQTAAGLAAQLLPLVLDRGRRDEMGAAALRRAREMFDVKVAAAKTVAFYDGL